MSITKMIQTAFKKLIADLQETFQTIEQADDDELLNKLIDEASKKLAKKIQKESDADKPVETEKKVKKEKKVKAKKTVYQLFCAKNRDNSLTFVEATRAVAAMWKALSDEEKAEFTASVKDQIDADVIRFNDEKSNSESDDDTTKKTKKEKDPNAPKRPLGSFMLFCKEKRENDSTLKGVEGTKRISEMWNSLSVDAKQVYTDHAKKLMNEFKGVTEIPKNEEKEVKTEKKEVKTDEKKEVKTEKSDVKEKVEVKEKNEKSDVKEKV